MADVNFLVKHFLRQCRKAGNTDYLDRIDDAFNTMVVNRAGMIVSTGSALGQSYSYAELAGMRVADVIAAKETAYSIWAEKSAAQIANYLDRTPQNKAVASFGVATAAPVT